jgi:hypothetical protein
MALEARPRSEATPSVPTFDAQPTKEKHTNAPTTKYLVRLRNKIHLPQKKLKAARSPMNNHQAEQGCQVEK